MIPKHEIRYIKRSNIDVLKYDDCVAKATNALIYAYSWYLDIVSDDWNALVMGDYEAVMPIPFLQLKRNLFLKKIYQPDFCQQLGIFAKSILSQKTADIFFNRFIDLNPKIYNFNAYNSQLFFKYRKELNERINYELKLYKSYEDIYANYSTNRKRNLKKAYKQELFISNKISVTTFLRFKKEQTIYQTKVKQHQKMKALVKEVIQREKANIYGVLQADQLIAVALILKNNQRLISLITATNETGKKTGAIAFLNDAVIKKNAKTTTIFDFEGSMLPGIARFYKSFGAEQMNYLSFES